MKVIATTLPGVLLIEPQIFSDSRGFFFECFNAARYAEYGMQLNFVQDNFSQSANNVLRGLHYQFQQTQGKLVWVTRGRVFDVAVDIRQGSPYFGQWVSVELNAEKPQQLYIPPGFAHGFCTLTDEVNFYYKCTNYYHPAAEKGIRWDDPALNIPWPIKAPILSEKDRIYPSLKEIQPHYLPNI